MKCLREIKRVTKKNGYIIIFEHNKDNDITRLFTYFCSIDRTVNLFTIKQVITLLSFCKLQIIDVDKIVFNGQFYVVAQK